MAKANWHEWVKGPLSVLVSYATPVACHIQGEGFYKTTQFHSVTTSRHINQWLRANGATMDKVLGLTQDELEKVISRT